MVSGLPVMRGGHVDSDTVWAASMDELGAVTVARYGIVVPERDGD